MLCDFCIRAQNKINMSTFYIEYLILKQSTDLINIMQTQELKFTFLLKSFCPRALC